MSGKRIKKTQTLLFLEQAKFYLDFAIYNEKKQEKDIADLQAKLLKCNGILDEHLEEDKSESESETDSEEEYVDKYSKYWIDKTAKKKLDKEKKKLDKEKKKKKNKEEED